ncbi:saccharopine dehydrogenase [Syncephalastrum racemosum]|uniref:Saccharopine dehydrogenase n=1 Tax=Syncephalastrum racemosum TaxID=13706 RepID=A0A1X2H3Z8_SYNRA|nr:saccharopine dehydrogenase [Syncephalastrum racemosum]
MSREYDLVVFGATGFTGSLVCEYIAQLKDRDLRWAMVGRNNKKLQEVKARLVSYDAECEHRLNLLTADSGDREALDQVVRKTRVVISTVGPFTKYGTPLIDACVENKTHYVDITGEFNWVKSIIDKYQDKARQDGTMIVPSCGFDSIPSDLGTFMQHIRKKHGLSVASVKASVIEANGGVSGGTCQSLVEAMSDSSTTMAQTLDPYLLAPVRGTDKQPSVVMRKDKDFGQRWQAFWVMAPTNEKVVRRSWALLTQRGQGYGQLFRYKETLSLPFLPAFALTAVMVFFGPLFALMLRVGFLRRVIQKVLPGSGQGPSREARENGSYELQFYATAETEPYDHPVRVHGIVKGFKDPGYGDTCRMLAESALCIVKSHDALPGKEGGILTPATAFGDVLLDRLRADGKMVFEARDL